MATWNSFTAFEGDCILDKRVFGAKTDFEFVEWVEKLRANPFQGAIPRNRVGDADRLLNKFFPAYVKRVHLRLSIPYFEPIVKLLHICAAFAFSPNPPRALLRPPVLSF